ncbi:hypothetical protein [Granulicella sp. S156]|uniref:hypothetical protein n=1 Tax=Granulicella sp. S156 TaxID=1747224 RepID=UPI00131EBFC3|nr:hypothetical protein [Granulicella sp. S156]
MRKRYINPTDAVHEKLFLRSHLTDEAILLALDGELSAKEATEVDTHVQSCWSCRGRKQATEQGIADLVDYQNAVTAPYLPPPSDKRAIFLTRLDALAVEMGQPSHLNRLRNGAIRLLRLARIDQLVWITGAIALIALVPFYYFLRTPPVVSADELLNLTAASEVRSTKTTIEPVVVQKVRITFGKTSLTRTMYRDVAHNRITSRTDANRLGEAQVKAAYFKSSLDWDSLLDANTYRRWRATRPASSNRVVRLGKDELKVETTSSASPVTEADITVRVADYHAVSESFRLQDQSEIEITELSYDVIPFASLSADIFGAPTQIAVVQLPLTAILRPTLPSGAELAEAEVEADSILHRLGADLGEQISLTSQDGHEVSIDGIVDDDTRKQQVVSALQNIPHTRLHILTIEEAQRVPSSIPSHVDSSAPSVAAMVATPPLLEAELNARFTDRDQRISYVNQTLSLAQLASARAWALNRLADRYPPKGVAVLDNEARRKLQVLLTDHVSALREDLSSLQNLVAEILPGSSNTPAANTSVATRVEPKTTNALESSEDWRDRIRRIHSSTEAVHESVVALLSSSQPSDQNDANAIEVNVRTSLTQLQNELQALDQKVHETDLR